LKARRQIAALPYRTTPTGRISVLLVTSRETKRWIIPKGWPWPKTDDHLAAAEEAREEAGIVGVPEKRIFGHYRYDKRKGSKSEVLIVAVYLFKVIGQLDDWPEAHQRERRWFDPKRASEAVEELELKALILKLKQRQAAVVASLGGDGHGARR
jgi:8-oxo-dGTP pyrophosphatase MutT (NUDIX family)